MLRKNQIINVIIYSINYCLPTQKKLRASENQDTPNTLRRHNLVRILILSEEGTEEDRRKNKCRSVVQTKMINKKVTTMQFMKIEG